MPRAADEEKFHGVGVVSVWPASLGHCGRASADAGDGSFWAMPQSRSKPTVTAPQPPWSKKMFHRFMRPSSRLAPLGAGRVGSHQHGEPRRAANELGHAQLEPGGHPSETLQLHAHIHNSPMSTEHLLGSRFVAAYGEGLEGLYDFAPRPRASSSSLRSWTWRRASPWTSSSASWCPSTATSSRACMAAVATLELPGRPGRRGLVAAGGQPVGACGGPRRRMTRSTCPSPPQPPRCTRPRGGWLRRRQRKAQARV